MTPEPLMETVTSAYKLIVAVLTGTIIWILCIKKQPLSFIYKCGDRYKVSSVSCILPLNADRNWASLIVGASAAELLFDIPGRGRLRNSSTAIMMNGSKSGLKRCRTIAQARWIGAAIGRAPEWRKDDIRYGTLLRTPWKWTRRSVKGIGDSHGNGRPTPVRPAR